MKNTRLRLSRREVLIGLAVIVVLAGLYLMGEQIENSQKNPEARGDLSTRFAQTDTLEVNGVQYTPKKNVTAILVMGIDQDSDTEIKGYRSGGQADFLYLVVTDKTAKTITLLPIDRNTITDVTMVDVFGREAGTRETQINLSHGYGDGKEQSCELTVRAVKNLLLDVPIDDYIAVTMDGISVLNDLCGGVTITLDEDLTGVDPAFQPGATVLLTGAQAESYTRARMGVGQGTNLERMHRQSVYISALSGVLKTKLQSSSFAGQLFDGMLSYTQTSMSRGLFVNRVWAARSYALSSAEIPGTRMLDEDGFEAFYPDEDALQDIVLTLFYDKVQ